ncbi:MAG TPA: (2Fe-2S)-binding protein [Burkholderiaceae bacterium]|nr:(2Fe-2S)-binding protein [Burkholderiaceae bacterium]
MGSESKALLWRVAECDRPRCDYFLDGEAHSALKGDTVLTAILTTSAMLRRSEFGGGPRAGFCLMGACQDCWVWLEDGTRIRACSTFVEPGMRVVTCASVRP